MRSVVGDSESSGMSDDDVSEHDASLTTAMTSMSVDKSAKTFVASFHRWMTSVDSGLSQASADMYARHTARFIEALGGTVGGLGRYVELTKKGGHLDELRKAHKLTSVKAALWGLKRAFAYVRLASMTDLFAADFCRHAEERIGNWTVNLKADAARQRHRHREAEDDVVRKLIELLPKFDVPSTEAFRRDGLVVSGRRGNACTITATQLRKAHIACARSAGRRPGDMYDLSRHMLHRLATQQASYDVADRNAQSVLVHTRMMEDTYRRRAPVASPAP
ncbi:hypothetical protein LSAT2_026686, partial [Lamellibrachia satsuma]